MARRTAPGAFLPVRRQLRRVRWRWNGRELGRAFCRLLALLAATAAFLVVGALRLGPGAFGLAAGAGATGMLVGVALVLRDAHRRWLTRRRAAQWTDRQAGLQGRLATLAELRAKDAASPFAALLVAQNGERLACWAPRRAVPRVVPRGAVAAAGLGLAALGLVLLVAPRLRRAPRDVVFSDEPVSLGAVSDLEDLPTRLLVAPVRSAPPAGRGGGGDDRDGGVAVPGATGGGSASALDRFQQEIRSRLLGDAGPLLREAKDADRGGAAASDGTGEPRETHGDVEAPSSDGTWEPVERLAGDAAPSRPPPGGRTQGSPPPPRLLEPGGDGDGGGGAGAGAGTDTDPNLLGRATEGGEGSGEGFALALGAEVRTRRGAAAAARDGPPPPSLDQHPALAHRQRAPLPVPRMPLPASWEPLVERLFAHGES